MGIESYKGLPHPPELKQHLSIYTEKPEEIGNLDLIAYIHKQGAEDAKKLHQYLSECNASLAHIRSLEAKGQVFGFKDYHLCMNACRSIVHQHKRLFGICTIIGSTSAYWLNPSIQERLTALQGVDLDEMKKIIHDQNVIILTFLKEHYAATYD